MASGLALQPHGFEGVDPGRWRDVVSNTTGR